jgi:hypothetical protein
MTTWILVYDALSHLSPTITWASDILNHVSSVWNVYNLKLEIAKADNHTKLSMIWFLSSITSGLSVQAIECCRCAVYPT